VSDGGIGAWIWIAPLSGAVIGFGLVKLEMNRRKAQHPEGGFRVQCSGFKVQSKELR
jgi:hypothetical protein